MGLKQIILNRNTKKVTRLIDKKKVYRIVKSFGVPKDCLERAYFQYLCHKKVNGKLISCFSNFSARFKIKKVLVVYQENFKEKDKDCCDAVFFSVLGKAIVPNSLKNEFDILEIESDFDGMLSPNDIAYVNDIVKRFGREPAFIFQCIKEIAKHRAVLNKYNPKAVISTDEISYTKTTLTDFFRKNGVLHIGVMHGMKWAELLSTFFEFDRFYVWEEFFKDLCVRLGANEKQFICEQPESVRICFDGMDKKNETDYKFFISLLNGRKAKRLMKIANKLRGQGSTVLIRPHPRYSNIKLLERIFKKNDIGIEYPNLVSIEESVYSSKNIVSVDSTVLYQAYKSGKTAVVDDISNPKRSKKLQNVDFIMLNLPECARLSDKLVNANES